MGIDVTHLVLETLGDADDHVVNDGADGTEGGDVLADTMVQLDTDRLLVLGVLDEGDADVLEVALELTTWALDGDNTGLDGDRDYFVPETKKKFQQVSLVAIPVSKKVPSTFVVRSSSSFSINSSCVVLPPLSPRCFMCYLHLCPSTSLFENT